MGKLKKNKTPILILILIALIFLVFVSYNSLTGKSVFDFLKQNQQPINNPPILGAGGQTWFAATNGSESGNGSIGNPWDLPTALFNWNGYVKPGDTLYVRGGTYHTDPSYPYFMTYINGNASNPITIMPYNNEKVIIDGPIEVYGEYLIFRDFEVTRDYDYHSENNSRVSHQNGDIVYYSGFSVWEQGVKIINNVVHDCPGIGIFVNCAPGAEIYGNILYNNGYDASDRGHGHGTYIQNANETNFILDNIAFSNLGYYGIHAYGEDPGSYREDVYNVYLENNTIFKNTFLVGGDNVSNITVIRNIAAYPEDPDDNGAMNIGYYNYNHTNAIIKNNLIYGKYFFIRNWDNLTLDNNTIVIAATNYIILNSVNNISALKINNNSYFVKAPSLYYNNDSLRTNNFTVWKSLGYDVNGTYTSSSKIGMDVYLYKNKYDSNRTDIVVLNWNNSDYADINLDSYVGVGAGYEIRDVQNYPVVIMSGTYNGGAIRFPLNLTNVSKYTGNWTGEHHSHSNWEFHTSKTFNTFVLRIASGGGAPIDNAPTVSLNSPANGYSTNLTSITFNCSATDDKRLTNISLYTNISSWSSINSTTCSGTTCSLPYTKTSIPVGTYRWNCLAYDNSSQSDWGDANYTFTIYNSSLQCSDGTLYEECSSTKPLYCDNGNLVNKCSLCNCSSGTCQSDESCETSNDNTGGGGGTGCDSGDKKCSGNILQVCSNGNWQNNETCANGCNSTTLACNLFVIQSNQTNQTVICNAGEKKCSDDGKNLLSCSNNSWVSQYCDLGCNSLNKECNSPIKDKIKKEWVSIAIPLIAIILIIIFTIVRKNYISKKNLSRY